MSIGQLYVFQNIPHYYNKVLLFIVLAALGPVVGILGATYSGCNKVMVTVMFTIGMGCMGFYYPSLGINTLDLSPNYSGTLMGFIAYGGLGGILSPYLVGVLAPDVSTLFMI